MRKAGISTILAFLHMTLPPKMVIFDCDGVLVDSEPLTNRVIRDSLASYGLDLSVDRVIDLFVGGTIHGVYEKSREMGAALPEGWVDGIYSAAFRVLAAEVEIIPGADVLLDRLDAAGIIYAVGSNGPHAKMEITLARTGLKDRLNGRVVSREDVPNPKPAPDVYLKAAADAGFGPQECVVIEDSANGAKAGKAAGMRCFGFARDTPRDRLEPICDALFDDMADLPALLGL